MISEVHAFVLDYLGANKPIPGANPEEKLGYDYLDAGHIDSFEIMQMILSMEERFAIRFSEEDLQSEEIRTIGGLAGIIERRAAEGAGE